MKEIIKGINLILFKKFYIFRDGGGNPCGFKWWRKWHFAFWCLRKWLRYEGMPNQIKDVDKILDWNKKIANR